MLIWTVIFVERGSVELKYRCVIGPHDSDVMWEHAKGLVDDGWVLACSKGTQEPVLGRLPIGKEATDWIRKPLGTHQQS